MSTPCSGNVSLSTRVQISSDDDILEILVPGFAHDWGKYEITIGLSLSGHDATRFTWNPKYQVLCSYSVINDCNPKK